MALLTLTERGDPAGFSHAEWSAGLSDALEPIWRQGVIGVRRAGQYWLVEPRNFVGFLRSPGLVVRIEPKAGSGFQDIRRMAAAAEKTVRAGEELEESAKEVISPHGPFIRALNDAVSVGLPASYLASSASTTRPKGRIAFPETIRRFASRGVRHMVACTITHREPDGDLVSVATAGLALAADPAELPAPMLRIARALQDVFLDVPQVTIEVALAVLPVLNARYADWPEVRQLLSRLEDLLDHEQGLWDLQSEHGAVDYRFADADRLWELAVLEAIGRELGGRSPCRASFHPYRNTVLTLFPDGGPDLDPDLVIHDEGSPVCVVDAKNSFSVRPSANDVYQVHAYAHRLRVRVAVLVYLSAAGDWVEEYGRGSDEVTVIALGVPVSDIVEGLSRAVRNALGGLLSSAS